MATNPNGNKFMPLFFYVIHEVDDEIYGSLYDHKPAWELERRFDVVYHFRGTVATYWIASNDRSITRDVALAFAVAVHEGRVRRYHIDLDSVNG